MNKITKFYLCLLTLTSLSLTITFFLSSAVRQTAAAGTITGRVFQDFNGNGAYNTSGIAPNTAIDGGIGSVTIKAYDGSGTLRGTATSAAGSGLYSLAATGTGPYRIEFTNLPAGYYPSARGTDSVNGGNAADSGSTVQFVADGNTSNVNLAVNSPNDYAQNNPLIVTPQYIQGVNNGSSLVNFQYDYSTDLDGNTLSSAAPLTGFYGQPVSRLTTQNTPLAIGLNQNIGSTYGLAYNKTTKKLFAGAYLKRDAPFGNAANGFPESTGAIYVKSNPASAAPAPTLYVDLNAVFGAGTAGANPHPRATTNWDVTDSNSDSATNPLVSKTALGDLEMSRDGSKIYAVNLFDKRLYVIPSTGALNSSTITRFNIPTTGLPTNGGGSVCQSSDVIPFGLGIDRAGQVYLGGSCIGSNQTELYVWKFNAGTFSLVYNTDISANSYPNYYTPILTGIEFSGNDLILGIRSQSADSMTGVTVDYPGNILKACWNGAGYTAESNGVCGANTTGGAGNGQGPNGGEFYYQDFNSTYNPESSLGGLLQIPGYDHVLMTADDTVGYRSNGAFYPSYYDTSGVQRHHNTNGMQTGSYDVYNYDDTVDAKTFGKTGGLGDLEALLDAAPIEIGNRVWRDLDGDGVQDPGENGIAGVTVRLYDAAGNLIAAAVTDANGEYYFSSAAGTSSGSGIYGLNLQPNTGYSIRIDNPANYNSGNPLAGLTLTKTDTSTQAGFADGSDSDGVNTANPVGSPAGVFPVVNLTTGGAGENNHNYDFGFTVGVTAAAVEVGGRVMDSRWRGIAGARVSLTDSNGKTKFVTTNSFGYFVFNDVQGQSAVIAANAKGFAFSQPNQYVNLSQSTDELYFIAKSSLQKQR